MPMQMPDAVSWLLFALTIAVILLTDRFPDRTPSAPAERTHRAVCLIALAAGIAVRLLRLSSLPAGPTAEEAMAAVQAKSLLQTGGFFGTGAFAAQLPQWDGQTAGPLLSILTAPFVALFGMKAAAVRLPLALVSCASLPAAYGAGEAFAGRRGARWLLLVAAASPIFCLTARLTAAECLSLPLLLIGLCFALRAPRRPALAFPACAAFGLLSWTEDLYFFLSPALIAAFAAFLLFARTDGGRKNGAAPAALSAAAIGLLLCLPGILTACASRANGADLRLGFVICPHLENRYTAGGLPAEMASSLHPDRTLFTKLWAVLGGGLFQIAMHETIGQGYFLPAGMTALYLFAVPLALLGAVSGLSAFLAGKRNAAAGLSALLGVVTLAAEVLYGSSGMLVAGGTTSVWDGMQMFPYTALLAAAGLLRMEKRSRAGFVYALAVYGASFGMLAFWLFGGGYAGAANVSFADYAAAAERAGEIREARGLPVAATSRVHPHGSPEEAARMLLLYAMDADMRTAAADPDAYGEIIWPGSMEEPPAGEVCLVAAQDSRGWYWDEEEWDCETFGRYILLIPK